MAHHSSIGAFTIVLVCNRETKICKSKEQLFTFLRLHKKKCAECRAWNYMVYNNTNLIKGRTESHSQAQARHQKDMQDSLRGGIMSQSELPK